MSAAHAGRYAVAYLRLPSAARVEGDASPREVESDQRLAIEAWARREGVEVRSWQLDVGVDGDTPIAERPGLLAAYASIRAHRAGLLVAANAERFGHDELVCWLIERAALTEGATLQTADGSRTNARVPSTSDQDVAYSRGAIDLARAYERVTFRSRVRAALAQKKARGERVGTVPYGYRVASDGVHVEPDEREQAVIATVRRLSAEGLSQRGIAAHLTAASVVGRTGAPLGQTQVGSILRAAR